MTESDTLKESAPRLFAVPLVDGQTAYVLAFTPRHARHEVRRRLLPAVPGPQGAPMVVTQEQAERVQDARRQSLAELARSRHEVGVVLVAAAPSEAALLPERIEQHR